MGVLVDKIDIDEKYPVKEWGGGARARACVYVRERVSRLTVQKKFVKDEEVHGYSSDLISYEGLSNLLLGSCKRVKEW